MTSLRALIVLLILCAVGLIALVHWSRLHYMESDNAVARIGTSGGGSPSGGVFGQFSPVDPPRPAPPLTFEGRDGSPRSLSELHGHWVLVNLWATWCEPCVREMPSLDRLQAKLGDRLTVLAVSEDRGAAHVVDPFLEKLGLKSLAIYLDPKNAVGQALGVRGLPTSLLIDGEGRIVGQLEGAAEWDSPAIVSKLETYMSGSAPKDSSRS